MKDEAMQKLNINDPLTHSPDLVADNIAQLKVLFPELVTEGPEGIAVNVDVLKALVGELSVSDTDEKYGLNWHGKRRARQLALFAFDWHPETCAGGQRQLEHDAESCDRGRQPRSAETLAEILRQRGKAYLYRSTIQYG
jgi:hypothetical protein